MTFQAAQRFDTVTVKVDWPTLLIGHDVDDDEQTVPFMCWQVADIVFCLRRGDGMLLGRDLAEHPDGSVTLEWDGYDLEDRPVGGRVTIPADQVDTIADWLDDLDVPHVTTPTDELEAMNFQHAADRDHRRETLTAGLPDTVKLDGRDLRLYAHDGRGVGLYRDAHPSLAPAGANWWVQRTPTGDLVDVGRPQAPDARGVPRRYLHPKLTAAGEQWTWVRTWPPSR